MESDVLIPAPAPAADPNGERLLALFQRIARRADELRGQRGSHPHSELECWLRAEREAFESSGLAGAAILFE